MDTKRHSAPRRAAFTLIEMMVVVALIGILVGGVFRLLSAAGENARRAETIERLQRVENAISGFYAKYGTYPPVPRHGSPDPFSKEDADGNTTSV
ncbi:MAG: type II secretion system protein, partial [Kiritimatiellia bacterium]